MIQISQVVSRRKSELGLSFQQIAEKSGLTDSSVKRIADGKTQNPRIDNLAALACALEMTFAQFLKECGYLKEGESNDL